jgi:hypothetical protein
MIDCKLISHGSCDDEIQWVVLVFFHRKAMIPMKPLLFSPAAGLKGDPFDRKRNFGLAGSHTRIKSESSKGGQVSNID